MNNLKMVTMYHALRKEDVKNKQTTASHNIAPEPNIVHHNHIVIYLNVLNFGQNPY